MQISLISCMDDVPPTLWQNQPGLPFLSRAWLEALEHSGAVSKASGWQPMHLLASEGGRPLALLPVYLKQHSRGEYVFDHAWADAYYRYQLPYYPKLVTALPFTPVPGPRCVLAAGVDVKQVIHPLLATLREMTAACHASGWHGLFLDNDWQRACQEEGMAMRLGCQFAWTDAGYGDFEGFLASLTSKRRKTIRAERRRISEQGIVCWRVDGPSLRSADWQLFYECYSNTYAEHGQHPYLPAGFFQEIAQTLADQIMMVIAHREGTPIATALFLHDRERLYGRYWGVLKPADCLHFEACYYQGIEYCLERRLGYFDPGTQGEHKLARGFAPIVTYSAHWLRDPAFMQAIQRFVAEEREYVDAYRQDAAKHLPFRVNP